MGGAFGGPETPQRNRHNIPDFLRTVSVKVFIQV